MIAPAGKACQTFLSEIRNTGRIARSMPLFVRRKTLTLASMGTDRIEIGDELFMCVLPTGHVRTLWRRAICRSSDLVLSAANEPASPGFARLDAVRLRQAPASHPRALTHFRLRAMKNSRRLDAAVL